MKGTRSKEHVPKVYLLTIGSTHVNVKLIIKFFQTPSKEESMFGSLITG